ncbi:multidrug effflux MFS transporter [Dietzia cinnamea]|uniref:multidrug effflux MFS transporter n=1 Tax=Dietzia cinnamea TaxID=321318 RepID=UPI0021A28471|nr:multidrug effflux MFS transporter [Dietzia cinnamea]MCT2057103.1 multidrug effflux MFS transporter [Dietzia cinnamea]MCT2119584.1 multidrug effflux MFS transporter [Dietzia cinnamea]MCT2144389.1 multidrug effflux MFS transporter [Dietzia cinnamea]MCT2304192.1 multidrug effflux MFS transporter [Dietzia cinnamea]
MTSAPSPTPPPTAGGVPAAMLVALAFTGAIGPFATDTYLPALPLIVDEFGVTASTAQLTLTAFMVSLALGQLVIGPISDRTGRRTLLLVGAIGTALAAVVCALAPAIWVLLAGRVAQGFFGAAGVVLAKAVIVDVGRGDGVAKAFATLMAIQSVAPVIAPLVGGAVVPFGGWRSVFWLLAALAAVTAVGVAVAVPESLPAADRRAGGVRAALSGMRAVATHGPFAARVSVFVFTFGVLFAYISASPFIYQDMVGLSPTAYAIAFTVNALGILVSNLAGARLVGRFAPEKLMGTGVVGMVVAIVFLVVVVALSPAGTLSLAPVTVGFIVLTLSIGTVLPNAVALAMQATGGNSGAGSALLGAAQFSLAAVVSPLTGLAGPHSAVPMLAVMGTCATIAVVAAWAVLSRPGRAT